MLGRAVLQAKDATIQSLQKAIEQQQFLLSESVVNITPKKPDDKEEHLDGKVALTKYQGKDFEANYAEIFRGLTNLFR